MARRLLLILLTLAIAALSASTANADSAAPPKEGIYADARSGVVLNYRDHRINDLGIFGGTTEGTESAAFPSAKVEHKEGRWEFAISTRDNPPWGKGHRSDATTVNGRLFLVLQQRRGIRQIDFKAHWVRP